MKLLSREIFASEIRQNMYIMTIMMPKKLPNTPFHAI